MECDSSLSTLVYLTVVFCFVINSSCATCHATCATCNGSSESQCITCRSGRFALDGRCLNTCQAGFYADKKRAECMPCPMGCATCASNGLCLTCQPNWKKSPKKNRCTVQGSDGCDECECRYILLYV